MNKTVTANISGIVFHIESEAYEKLHKYLNTIRNYFHDSDGKDEIMADIESRIAELFKEALTNGREVVTMAEVNRVVEIMGEPEQYMDESASDEYDYQQQQQQSSSSSQSFKTKKLYRDEDDKVLGGVCAGLGHYFGIDRIWIRVLFLIAVIAGIGSGVIIYIILWAIIPKALTTAEKLEMKGEPINVENIGNTIKDEFNSFKKKVNNDSNNYGQKASDGLSKFFDFLGRVLTAIFKFAIKAIGVLIIIGAALGLVTIISLLIGAPGEITINHEHFGDYWNPDFGEIFFASGTVYTLTYIGIALICLIPLSALLYGGLKILFKIPSANKAVGLAGISLFVIGIAIIIFSTINTASLYTNKQNITEVVRIDSLSSDTLRLSSLDEHYSTGIFNAHEIFIENDYIYTDNMSVNVVQSADDQLNIRLNKASRGSSRKDAGARAEHIDFTYEIDDNKLSISPYIDFPIEDRFRVQEVEIIIELPVGKSIYLEESSVDIIYDIKNVSNTWDGKMIRHTWLMTEKGLQCTDCPWIDWEDDEEEETEDS